MSELSTNYVAKNIGNNNSVENDNNLGNKTFSNSVTINKQNQINDEIPETCTFLKEILINGNIGSLTFLVLFFAVNAQIFIMGHVPNSQLMISSIGTAYPYMFIISYGICGFNSGLLIMVSRCKANNDFKRMRKFLKLGSTWCNIFI